MAKRRYNIGAATHNGSPLQGTPQGRTAAAAKAVGTSTQVGVFAGNVAASARWRGSGPAHWHNGNVRRTQTWAHVKQPALPLAEIRKRGMYGY